MGLYRLFLAVLVLLSHSGHAFYGYNPGVVAVISFFILSGYVMSILIEKHYKSPHLIVTFYLDRAVRLFPQFVFYMLLTTLCIYIFKIESPFLNQLTLFKWVLNLLILPQGFFMYWADGALVIPQTWSLGLELTFYLIIPWVLIYLSKPQIYVLAGVSFMIFLTAYFGRINSDNFGYRLLPGTLFIFLVGWSFFQSDRPAKIFRLTIFILSVCLLCAAYMNKAIYQLPFNKEVLVGLLIGIVLVSYMKHFTFSHSDEFFGNLSYGVFLNHFIVIWMMQKFFAVNNFEIANTLILILLSSVLALGSYFYIERPALKLRHAIRYGAASRKLNAAVKFVPR